MLGEGFLPEFFFWALIFFWEAFFCKAEPHGCNGYPIRTILGPRRLSESMLWRTLARPAEFFSGLAETCLCVQAYLRIQ